MRHSEAKQGLLDTLCREVSDRRVLDAIATVPREAFVLPRDGVRAYEDAAMPVGEGPTTSPPLIVAIMLQVMELRPSDHALAVCHRHRL